MRPPLPAAVAIVYVGTSYQQATHCVCHSSEYQRHKMTAPVPPIFSNRTAIIDFDQIADAAEWLELWCRGLLGFSPYASSFAWLLFLYDYHAHHRRGVADRLRQHLTITERESASPSTCNRSDSYGGDTTSLTARRERSIASKIRLFGRCDSKSGH